jgi:hypothetical protein
MSSIGRRVPEPRARIVRRGSTVLAAVVSCGVVVASVPAVAAVPPPRSQSVGRFLTAKIGNASLDRLVQLTGAAAGVKGESAANTGGPAVTHQDVLTASVLNHPLLNLPSGVQLPGGGVVQLGAANQYAQAAADGSAHGASGAVTNSGVVGIGGPNAPQSDATLDLTGSSNPLAALGSLRASVGAIAATADQAAGKNGAQVGHYEIASLKLTLSSPALSQAIKQLTGGSSQVPGLSDLISTLASTGLPVGTLEKVGTADPVTALTKALTSLGNVDLSNGAITGSLTNGTLTVDVAKLLKSTLNLDLNNLPPNTHLIEVVAKALPQALTNGLTQLQAQLTSGFKQLSLAGTPLPPGATQVNDALTMLLNPLAKALSSGATGLSASVFSPMAKNLEKLVDVVVNVQERAGGTFTERALQLDLIGDPMVTVDIASASVGPSAPGVAPAPPGSTLPGPTHSAVVGGSSHLADTGAGVWLTKVALFGLLGLCMGAALFGATIGIRRSGRHAA